MEIRVTITFLLSNDQNKHTHWPHWALICRSGLDCPDGRFGLSIGQKTLMLLDNSGWMAPKSDDRNRRTPLPSLLFLFTSPASSSLTFDSWQIPHPKKQSQIFDLNNHTETVSLQCPWSTCLHFLFLGLCENVHPKLTFWMGYQVLKEGNQKFFSWSFTQV